MRPLTIAGLFNIGSSHLARLLKHGVQSLSAQASVFSALYGSERMGSGPRMKMVLPESAAWKHDIIIEKRRDIGR